MVLFDESPAPLINATTSQFHIAPDKDSLARITTSLSTLSSVRSSQLQQTNQHLKALARRLNTLQSQHQYEEERHDASRHASEMLRLDTEKFRIAKGVSDAEVEGERLRGELGGLRAQVQGSRDAGDGLAVGQGEGEVVLKLHFYRSLGIDINQDATTGEVTRAVIRNPERGDVDVVEMGREGSQASYAQRFWDAL